MGARLVYAKVVDRAVYYAKGGRIHPGLDNQVLVHDEPGRAGVFLVLRAWGEDHGTFTEQWKIKSPGGKTLYESAPREIHLPTETHTEKLEDEIADLDIDYAAEDYMLVIDLDDREVARVNFPVRSEPLPEGILGA